LAALTKRVRVGLLVTGGHLPAPGLLAVKHHAVDTAQSLSAIVESALSQYFDGVSKGERSSKHGD